MYIVDSTVEINKSFKYLCQDGMCRYCSFNEYSALINRNRYVKSGSPLGVVVSTYTNSLLNVANWLVFFSGRVSDKPEYPMVRLSTSSVKVSCGEIIEVGVSYGEMANIMDRESFGFFTIILSWQSQ